MVSERVNSFDSLRLVGSIIVLIGHAFIITGGTAPNVGTIPLHVSGVCIFFAISGYLITQSWLSDDNPVRFLTRRLLRLWPALVVTVAITALVIGPIVSSQTVADYFGQGWVRSYVLRNSLMLTVWGLPGVFDGFPLAGQVNGSLWTLPIEFLLYLAVPVFVLCWRVLPRLWPWVLIALAIAVTALVDVYPAVFKYSLQGVDLGKGLSLAPYFWVGSALRLLNLTDWSPRLRKGAVIVAAILFVPWSIAPTLVPLASIMPVPIALLVLEIGLSSRFHLRLIDRVGDLSYGTYLWAFPVQQTIFQFTRWGSFGNMAAALPIVLGLAYLSWHLIEKPALRLKPRRRRRPDKTSAASGDVLQAPGAA